MVIRATVAAAATVLVGRVRAEMVAELAMAARKAAMWMTLEVTREVVTMA